MADTPPDTGETGPEPNGEPVVRRHMRRDIWLESAALAVFASAVFFVHPFGYVVHHPYWGDESWVAVLSKAPLTQWLSLSSSTPIGWLLTVRWAPLGRDDLRIVALVFSAGDVAMAYVVARNLPWRSRPGALVAGYIAGAVVLLAPISLLRNDLKQYTGDAFFALVLIAVTCCVDARPTRRNLALLVATSAVSIFFSTAAAFVVVAVFSALAINALASGSTARIRDIAIGGAVAFVVLGLYFRLVILPQDNPALRNYWKTYYLSWRAGFPLSVAWQRLDRLAPVLAMPAWLLVALVIVGMIVLMRFGRPSVALAVPILWAEMLVAGLADKYPFLDQRTSHFALILSLTIAAIGVAGIVALAGARSRLLACVLIAAASLGFVHDAEPYIRNRSLPNEDVRSQVLYVARHFERGDIMLVGWQSNWGFTYYWPGGERRYEVDHSGKNSNGFFTHLANRSDIIYAQGRAQADTNGTMQQALALARAPIATGRIWLIRTHVSAGEHQAWQQTFKSYDLKPETIRVGTEPVLLIDTRHVPA